MVIVLVVTKRWQSFKEDCRALWADKKRGAILLMAAFIISLNWLTYIWGFRERVSGLKKISLLLAAIGIVLMTYQLGKLPWVAVVLAVSSQSTARSRKSCTSTRSRASRSRRC